jgi:hypothetical protein
VGIVGRQGRDEPVTPFRPGGAQVQSSIGLRLDARWPAGVQTHLTLRHSRARDSIGYSVLLEDNAVRQTRARQAVFELVWPLAPWLGGPEGLALVAQAQRALQASNLALFKYSARSAYGGLRYVW